MKNLNQELILLLIPKYIKEKQLISCYEILKYYKDPKNKETPTFCSFCKIAEQRYRRLRSSEKSEAQGIEWCQFCPWVWFENMFCWEWSCKNYGVDIVDTYEEQFRLDMIEMKKSWIGKLEKNLGVSK